MVEVRFLDVIFPAVGGVGCFCFCCLLGVRDRCDEEDMLRLGGEGFVKDVF